MIRDALDIYRECLGLIEITRDVALVNDAVRWDREDLIEAAMDLKLAVIDLDRRRTAIYSDECIVLMMTLRLRIRELHNESEGPDE